MLQIEDLIRSAQAWLTQTLSFFSSDNSNDRSESQSAENDNQEDSTVAHAAQEPLEDEEEKPVLTPLQESLQLSIEKLKSEGKPHPKVTFETKRTVPSQSEIEESIQSQGSFETHIKATTLIEYEGPEQAGKERWDDIIVSVSEEQPDTMQEEESKEGRSSTSTSAIQNNSTASIMEEEEVLMSGNLTQMVIDKYPEIYGEGEGRYQYGEEPRTFVIEEDVAITFVEADDVSSPLVIQDADTTSTSSNIVMGFSYVPKKIDYTVNPKVKVWFITLAEAKAGFLLDVAFGLRLPVQVDVTYPERMVVGQEYFLDTSITPLDFSAADYEDMDLPPEDGQEFFARFEVFLGLKAWVAGFPVVNLAIDSKVDMAEQCSIHLDTDCQNFVTPFGLDENGSPREFPVRELRLDPDQTGIKYNMLGIISLGLGIMIDPDIGSDRITADWSAEHQATGSGEVVYSAAFPSQYSFGPITAVASSNSISEDINVLATNVEEADDDRVAIIALDNYKYHLNRQTIGLYGNLQLQLLGATVGQTGYAKLAEFNFETIFGETVIGQHEGVTGVSSTIPVSIGGGVDDGQLDQQQVPAVVKTDRTEYSAGDEVIVTGNIGEITLVENQPLLIGVFDPNGTIVRLDQFPYKEEDGSFTYTFKAGGIMNTSGEHRIRVTHDGALVASTTFHFTSVGLAAGN